MAGTRTRRGLGWAAVLLAGLTSGCLVEVTHVSDPGAAFTEARREAARYQGRPGPAHQVNVLVYDEGERQLVRVSVPMWLARKVAARNEGFDVDLGDAGAEDAVRRHVRFKDIERAAGLGILVEVEEEGGDQVLVWLK